MEKKQRSTPANQIKAAAGRLSREEKIRVLTAVQEFGLGTQAAPQTPIHELDQVYCLAARWRAELEVGSFGQKKNNVIFVSFGSI